MTMMFFYDDEEDVDRNNVDVDRDDDDIPS